MLCELRVADPSANIPRDPSSLPPSAGVPAATPGTSPANTTARLSSDVTTKLNFPTRAGCCLARVLTVAADVAAGRDVQCPSIPAWGLREGSSCRGTTTGNHKEEVAPQVSPGPEHCLLPHQRVLPPHLVLTVTTRGGTAEVLTSGLPCRASEDSTLPLLPGWGTKIPHAKQCDQKIKIC